MNDKIEITVNGSSHHFEKPILLEAVLNQLKINTLSIAIILNNKVIPKSELPQTKLQNGDHIELLSAAQGG